jgi:hypothetical protein
LKYHCPERTEFFDRYTNYEKQEINLLDLSVESFITNRSAVRGGVPYTTDPALDINPENTALGCCVVSGKKNC